VIFAHFGLWLRFSGQPLWPFRVTVTVSGQPPNLWFGLSVRVGYLTRPPLSPTHHWDTSRLSCQLPRDLLLPDSSGGKWKWIRRRQRYRNCRSESRPGRSVLQSVVCSSAPSAAHEHYPHQPCCRSSGGSRAVLGLEGGCETIARV
jgi:hypothetical protein